MIACAFGNDIPRIPRGSAQKPAPRRRTVCSPKTRRFSDALGYSDFRVRMEALPSAWCIVRIAEIPTVLFSPQWIFTTKSPSTLSLLKLDIPKSLPREEGGNRKVDGRSPACILPTCFRIISDLLTDKSEFSSQLHALSLTALRRSSLPDGAFWILTLKYKVLFGTMY